MLLLGSFASRLAKSDDWSTSASPGKRNSLLASASVGLCALMVRPPLNSSVSSCRIYGTACSLHSNRRRKSS